MGDDGNHTGWIVAAMILVVMVALLVCALLACKICTSNDKEDSSNNAQNEREDYEVKGEGGRFVTRTSRV